MRKTRLLIAAIYIRRRETTGNRFRQLRDTNSLNCWWCAIVVHPSKVVAGAFFVERLGTEDFCPVHRPAEPTIRHFFCRPLWPFLGSESYGYVSRINSSRKAEGGGGQGGQGGGEFKKGTVKWFKDDFVASMCAGERKMKTNVAESIDCAVWLHSVHDFNVFTRRLSSD